MIFACRFRVNAYKLKVDELSIDRISLNLEMDPNEVVDWCMDQITSYSNTVLKSNDNWLVHTGGIIFTINQHDYRITSAVRALS